MLIFLSYEIQCPYCNQRDYLGYFKVASILPVFSFSVIYFSFDLVPQIKDWQKKNLSIILTVFLLPREMKLPLSGTNYLVINGNKSYQAPY